MNIFRLRDEVERRWPGCERCAATDDPAAIDLFRTAHLFALAGHPVPALKNFFFFEGFLISRDTREPFVVLEALANQLKETPNAP